MKHNLTVYRGKTLKLLNPLICKLEIDAIGSLGMALQRMENYVLTKGKKTLGPIIQHSCMTTDINGTVNAHLELIRQLDGYIVHTDAPYKMYSEIKVSNCLYIRFEGKESDLKFAYNKIGVVAYEEGIKVSDEHYTVLLKSEDDNIIADIFAPII